MSRKYLLLIDDEPALLRALSVRLSSAGHEVAIASSGEMGLLMAGQRRPDLILLDVRMPGMDGFEVCRQLKTHIGLSMVPVLFMSANVMDSVRVTAQQVGGIDVLAKPFQSQKILDAIAAVFDVVVRTNV